MILRIPDDSLELYKVPDGSLGFFEILRIPDDSLEFYKVL